MPHSGFIYILDNIKTHKERLFGEIRFLTQLSVGWRTILESDPSVLGVHVRGGGGYVLEP